MQKKGTAWIVGASGGLGLATANAFAQNGWLTIAGARSFAKDAQTQPVREGEINRRELDVTNEESCDHFVQEALRISSRVDAVVCCAAQLVLGSCEQIGIDELANVMDTNFLGTVRMIQRAMPIMRRNGGGKIILFSSINGLLGVPFQGAYTASKHALEGFAECLEMEAREYGIQVCLVEPGDHRGGGSHTRLRARGEDGQSAYHAAYETACAVIARDEANGLPPKRLGELVERNASKTRMRFRMRVAKPDQHLAVWLHRLLPQRLNGRILRGYYGLSRKKQR